MKVSITIEADINEEAMQLEEIGDECGVDVLGAVKIAMEAAMEDISNSYHVSVQEL